MNRLFGWWLRIPRQIRLTALTLVTLAILGYMVFLGGRSMLDDPNFETLWLSVIGASLLTFIVYRATKKCSTRSSITFFVFRRMMLG